MTIFPPQKGLGIGRGVGGLRKKTLSWPGRYRYFLELHIILKINAILLMFNLPEYTFKTALTLPTLLGEGRGEGQMAG